MTNVLPIKDRKELQINYWLRVGATFSFIAAISLMIGLVSLFPAYLLAQEDLKEAMIQQEIQEKTREAAKQDSAIQTARLVTTQIEDLLKNDRVNPTEAIETVIEDWKGHADTIIISGFAYSTSKERPELRVSGDALDRTSLNSFVQTLRKNEDFYNVSFPVSDLAGTDIINFSLVVKF